MKTIINKYFKIILIYITKSYKANYSIIYKVSNNLVYFKYQLKMFSNFIVEELFEFSSILS